MGVFVKKNLAMRIRKIAENNGIPMATAETIIRELFDSWEESLMNGERVTIGSIVTVTPYRNVEKNERVVSVRVLPSLKKRINNK